MKNRQVSFFLGYADMHEFSVARSLIKLVEDIVADNEGRQVSKVIVKIGKLSGVEPYLLQTAFDVLKEESFSIKDATLVINVQDIVCRCRECGAEFVAPDFDVVCKTCGSYDTEVIDGKDMILESIELR